MSELFTCSQCGRDAPVDRSELASWKNGDLALNGELDGVAAAMLLCPTCSEEDRDQKYEAGGGG